MTDLLVGLVGFIVCTQAAIALRAVRRRHPQNGSEPGLLLLSPVFWGMAGTAAVILPHLVGGFSGLEHAASDVDAAQPGRVSPLVLALLAFFGLRLGARWLREASIGWRLWRSSGALAADEHAAPVARLRAQLAAHGCRLVLHTAGRFPAPFLRGLLRPRLYLHRDLPGQLTGPQMEAVVFHELAHLCRRDHQLAWLYVFLVAPLNLSRTLSRSFRRWREASEVACDDFAAARSGSRRLVAEAIVEVVRFGLGRHGTDAVVAFSGTGREVKRRVERLLSDTAGHPATSPGSAGRRYLLAGLAVLAAIALTSWAYPAWGLEAYCFLEHVVGTHCLG